MSYWLVAERVAERQDLKLNRCLLKVESVVTFPPDKAMTLIDETKTHTLDNFSENKRRTSGGEITDFEGVQPDISPTTFPSSQGKNFVMRLLFRLF